MIPPFTPPSLHVLGNGIGMVEFHRKTGERGKSLDKSGSRLARPICTIVHFITNINYIVPSWLSLVFSWLACPALIYMVLIGSNRDSPTSQIETQTTTVRNLKNTRTALSQTLWLIYLLQEFYIARKPGLVASADKQPCALDDTIFTCHTNPTGDPTAYSVYKKGQGSCLRLGESLSGRDECITALAHLDPLFRPTVLGSVQGGFASTAYPLLYSSPTRINITSAGLSLAALALTTNVSDGVNVNPAYQLTKYVFLYKGPEWLTYLSQRAHVPWFTIIAIFLYCLYTLESAKPPVSHAASIIEVPNDPPPRPAPKPLPTTPSQ